jgi:hypothetical protein
MYHQIIPSFFLALQKADSMTVEVEIGKKRITSGSL